MEQKHLIWKKLKNYFRGNALNESAEKVIKNVDFRMKYFRSSRPGAANISSRDKK